MKREWHLIFATVILGALWYFIEEIKSWMIILPIILTTFPDWDLLITPKEGNYHRNWFTHSVILWVLLYLNVKLLYNYPFVTLLFALCLFSVGVHLLLDITTYPSKWRGTYCLKFLKSSFFWWLKKGRGIATTIWLVVNFTISAVVLIYEVCL